ncbi:S26 family signal peptidase [Rubripirellula obstinata]|uniref:S26 family signal peptidase n=1 Tax=Rubripirellula obstinata TaxID=406547 RepID=UPI000A5075C7|nr:S26 family signal peptidase [Rubripirellula obstinata]
MPLLDHVSRRRFAAISIATAVFAISVSIVNTMRPNKAKPKYFQISGFSMAPTLMGRSQIMRCRACLFQSRFPIAPDQVGCQCSHCGHELQPTGETVAADLVQSNGSADSVKRWDLVAITGTNPNRVTQQVVKRVIGVPGDQVDIRGSRLTINGTLINDLPSIRQSDRPSVSVYQETGKGSSRWKIDGDWLVYHHVNPYRGSAPSPVLDDYSVNVHLSRQLEPVTDLMIRFRSKASEFQNAEIVIWKPNHDSRFAALVSERNPIAIRIPNGHCDPSEIETSQIEIRRRVLYRLRPRDDRSKYPMLLDKDEYFVLGDNVPISVDSRDWGAVHRSKILCLVSPLESKTR